MKKWKDKTAFTRKQFLGSKRSRTKVMKSIRNMDTKNVLNLYDERKELFNTIKKYRVGKGKVTNEGLKMALTELKYDTTNSLDKKEIKTLAKEFNIKGKLDRKVLRKSKAFLEKKKSRLSEKYEKTHKLSKEMKFFFPYVNLGELISSKAKPIVKHEYINNGSSFRQKLENYKLKANHKKKQQKLLNIFVKNKKNKSKKKNISISKNFDKESNKEQEKEVSEIKKVAEKEKNIQSEKKFDNTYKNLIKEEKEQYKNRYRVDLKKKKDEYKHRYREKVKKEALEKISKYVNKDISKDKDNKKNQKKQVDGINKYKQKYLDIKEKERNRYRIDVNEKKENYKNRYRIEEKNRLLQKKYETYHKDELEKKSLKSKEENNKNLNIKDQKQEEKDVSKDNKKEDKTKSNNIEFNIIKAAKFRGKEERDVRISEESVKNSLEDQKIQKEKIELHKKDKMLKKIQLLTKQIMNKSAPVHEYDSFKKNNALFYITIKDLQNKKEPENMIFDNKI